MYVFIYHRLNDAILYMNMLLDQTLKLKAEAHSPIHIQELRRLVMLIITETSTLTSTGLPSAVEVSAEEDGGNNTMPTMIPHTAHTDSDTDNFKHINDDTDTSGVISQVKAQNTLENKPAHTQKQHNNEQLLIKLDKLLTRMTYAVDSDSNIWDVYAVYHQCFDRGVQAKDCRVKQVCNMFMYCLYKEYCIQYISIIGTLHLYPHTKYPHTCILAVYVLIYIYTNTVSRLIN